MKTRIFSFFAMTFIALSLLWPAQAQAEQAVCVRIKLEIPQKLSFERDAFDASLALTNNLQDAPLESLNIEVQFRDTNDQRVDERFFLSEANISQLTGGISGAGVIAPEQTGHINWLIIPTPGAGGVSPAGVQYKVKAIIDYSVGGVEASIETYDEIITVKPQPELLLDYFLPRKVKGDDPFTPAVEPSVPFDLAVRVANVGYGDARNLRIVSGQPRIVENDQGALIDFEIIGTFRNDDSIENSLAIPFGTLAAGRCAVGSWAMTTSLAGEFVDLAVNFEHSEEFGGAKTSLVSGTRSHRLIHRMQVDSTGQDEVSDLLAKVDSDGDGQNDAEQIFTSQCQQLDVYAAAGFASGSPDLNDPTALLRATVEVGWNHVTAADPAQGNLPILRAVRQSDGKILHWRNAWRDEDDSKPAKPLLALADYSVAGGVEESWLITYDMSEFDQVPPQSWINFIGPTVSGSPMHIAPVTIMTIGASDDLSGVMHSEYRLDGGDWQGNGPFYFQSEGPHQVEFRSTDRKGNIEAIRSQTFVVDGQAPEISIESPETGRAYLNTESLLIQFAADDLDPDPQLTAHIFSANDSLLMQVDSEQSLNLSDWELGAYRLEIDVEDWLGNHSQLSTVFLVQSEVAGCVNLVEGASCDDGNPCTVADTCQNAVCVGGGANSCDDGNLCTNDSCDLTQGCQHSFNTLPCDDGNACSENDLCDGAGSCAGQSVSCDDDNVCTTDSCDVQLGCQHDNNSANCDDGNNCTAGDVCREGTCIPGDPVASGTTCDDGSACTQNDVCDGAGTCQGINLSCEDNNVCTQDSCDPQSGCVHQDIEEPCDDDNTCTTDDTCQSGDCVGQALPAGSPCNDGLSCTGQDLCDGQAQCQGPVVTCDNSSACSETQCCGDSEVSCDDDDPCTADLCLASGSACAHIAIEPCNAEDAGFEDAASADIDDLDANLSDSGSANDVPNLDAFSSEAHNMDATGQDVWTTEVDAGNPASPPVNDTGCGCTSTNSATGRTALFFLGLLALWRERRKNS